MEYLQQFETAGIARDEGSSGVLDPCAISALSEFFRLLDRWDKEMSHGNPDQRQSGHS